MSADTLPLFLTPEEVAVELGVNRMSVYRLIWNGKLGFNNIGTGKRKRIRVSRAALKAFEQNTERGV